MITAQKQQWRFLGSNSSIEGVASLTEFGQQIELSPDMAAAALRICCIPDAQFSEIGFTDEELAVYKWPASHDTAVPAFLQKKRAALAVLHMLRYKTGV